ncbi:hypothetical protein [Seohaeicola saemankumensis]|uniref:hypothetical protein n=1 Tax=Seohaeicola saemankumensis TaxID=481181 RepID=UPI003AF3662C
MKHKLAHGEYEPWCEENLTFTKKTRAIYIKVAEVKSNSWVTFQQANSIREMLDFKDTKPEPSTAHRAATLDDLRKVEHLRAKRDEPQSDLGGAYSATARAFCMASKAAFNLASPPPYTRSPTPPRE